MPLNRRSLSGLAPVFCALLLLLSACGATVQPALSNPPTATPVSLDSMLTPGAMPTVAASDDLSATLPTPDTTSGRIYGALSAGAISKPTAWLYQLYSAFDPARLPLQYQGADFKAGTAAQLSQARVALALALANWNDIPADAKTLFAPFQQRPTATGSFWQGGATVERVAGAAASYDYVDAAQTPLRVWYVKGGDNRDLAARLAQEIDSAGTWNKEKAVMLGNTPCSDADIDDNGGNGRFDIYIVPPNKSVARPDWDGDKAKMSGDYYGITIPQDSAGDCPSADFILLNDDQEWDDLRSTAAHELFHAFQDSFSTKDEDASAWWAEASATWAEDYIYPTLDKEQAQLQDGGWAKNSSPLGPLDQFQDGGLAQYGAYIWPFYLTHRPGGDPKLIGQIYGQLDKKTPLQVMYAMPDWNQRFKEFALWNWNWAPVDMYRDNGRHIDPLMQSPTMLGNKGKLSLDNPTASAKISLKETSIGYYEIARVDDGSSKFVHQLKIDTSNLSGQAGAGIQALIWYANGTTAVEDWSGNLSKIYCRDNAAQKVTKLVLIVTNSNIKASQKLRGQIDISASNRCR